ncbi:MAG: deoxyribonuclease V [Pyrinomonadaceae bacterium]
MAFYQNLHEWNVSPKEAINLQNELRHQVKVRPLTKPVQTIAGADISFDRFSPIFYCAIVVLNLTTLETIEEVSSVSKVTFPYIPGLLSFREIPSILEAWSKLKLEPDAVMFDGHGIAHPRRLGIASHAGLVLKRPTFGCAKSILVGRHQALESERGSLAHLIDREESVGVALRTKTNVQPIYVSVGTEIDLNSAIDITLQCFGGYRQPEPTRRAHLLVNEIRRSSRSS